VIQFAPTERPELPSQIRDRKVSAAVSGLFLTLFVLSSTRVMHPFAAAASVQAPQTSGTSTSPSTTKDQTAQDPPDTTLSKAQALLQDGKVDEAQVAVRKYLRDHSNSADAHFLLGYVLFKRAQAPVSFSELDVDHPELHQPRKEDAQASLAEYTEGAKYRPPSAFDLKVVALDYVFLKDYADADRWLTRSLGRNPGDTEGWYYLGRTKYNENRFEEAISAFQQYLKLDPKSVKGEDNLGLSYQGLSRNEDAKTAYRTAISWQEHNLNQDPGPFINLAALLLDENQPQEALPYLLQAVTISPQEIRAHEQLGRAYERMMNLPKAQHEFETAVELAPQNSRLHYLLGRVYQRQGLAEKAKQEFDRSNTLRAAHSSTEDRDR
jgi:Flp pilus assembly protein TadD